MNRIKHSVGLAAFAALSAIAMLLGFAATAQAAYVQKREARMESPEVNFTSGAGVRGIYGVDTQTAVDKGGNIWVWGFFGPCSIDDAGMGGYYEGAKDSDSIGRQNGALYTGADCSTSSINNRPSVIRGVSGFKSVAGSAYALMGVDSYGNLYGWGDNTQGGVSVPMNQAYIAAGGKSTPATGGTYGIYKDGTGAPEPIPNKVNQANPAADADTWKPIDGPGAPIGKYPDGNNTSKVTKVASNEYGFAWLKEDGTVWTVGVNTYGQRGVGKHGSSGWGDRSLNGYPVGNVAGVAYVPTKADFPSDVKIKDIFNGYEGYFAVDTNNTVYYWGRSFDGAAGLSEDELDDFTSTNTSKPCLRIAHNNVYCYAPVKVPSLTEVIANNGGGYIKGVGGYSYGALLTSNNKLWTWGTSTDGIGMPESDVQNDAIYRSEPRILSAKTTNGGTVTADNVIDMNGGYHSAQFVTMDGYIWGWGSYLWGGAFSGNMSPTADSSPTNITNSPGIIWDPTRDPTHRKGVSVGGNKDAANFNLDDDSVYSYGENGGGAALGGKGYGQNICAQGLPGCVSPKVELSGSRSQAGIYVWPATFVPEMQNLGKYQTVVKNSLPFQGTAVKTGDVINYHIVVKNDRTAFMQHSISIADTWGLNGRLVNGSFKAKYSLSNAHQIDKDVTNQFQIKSTGYETNPPGLTQDAQSILVIDYAIEVTGSSGDVGGKITLTDLTNRSVIDSDGTSNPIRSN